MQEPKLDVMNRKNKIEWELNQVFQEHWVAHLCWAKPAYGVEKIVK